MKKLIPWMVATAWLAGSWQAAVVAQDKNESADKVQEQTGEPAAESQTRRPRSSQRPEWTEMYDRRFRESTPMLDDYAPEVSAFDEHGNEFDLSSTRGKYTVIVFGCLT